MASSKPTILIVDDIPDNCMLLECLLDDDYETETASSGQECLDHLDANEPPSLMLLDVRMPEMNGFELCEKLKSDKKTKSVPIIFVTAETGQEEKLKGYEVGADDFISKPFDQDELCAKVRRSIKSSNELEVAQKKAKSARDAAMLAMNTSSDLGAIIQFMEAGSSCNDFNALAIKLLDITKSFGLVACFQFHHNGMVFNIGNGCDDGTVEARMMLEARKRGKIVGTGQRAFFNQEHVSMLIKNMPIDDKEAAGRFRDNLSVLVNAAENVSRAIALAEEVAEQRRGGIQTAIATAHSELEKVNDMVRGHNQQLYQMLDGIRNEFEDNLLTLGLTEQQEVHLLALFEEGFQQLETMKDTEAKIDDSLHLVLNNISKLTH